MTRGELVELMAKAEFKNSWPNDDWESTKKARREVYLEIADRHFTALQAAGMRFVGPDEVVMKRNDAVNIHVGAKE